MDGTKDHTAYIGQEDGTVKEIPMPTIPEMNRYVCGKVGIDMYCSICFVPHSDHHQADHAYKEAPDFSDDAGAVLLLRKMMEREDWIDFRDEHLCTFGNYISCVDIITPAALLRAAYEWFKGKEG